VWEGPGVAANSPLNVGRVALKHQVEHIPLLLVANTTYTLVATA
jgi:hypothetical protein